jgi:hypothetical protein
MESGDVRIHPPILGADKKLRVFFWRKQGSGYGLYRHVFSGELKQKGAVVTEKILDIPYAPLFTGADPVAIFLVRKKGFEERGLAVIAWLSSDSGGMRAHAVWLKGEDAKAFDSDPIAGYKPHPDQRIGIYADPEGAIHLSWLMGRTDADSLRVAEWTVDVNHGSKNLRICENAFTGTRIHSSACIFERNPALKQSVCYLLTETGNLYAQRAMGKPKSIRTGVSLNYDFPIFASAYQSYEAQLKPDGAIHFEPVH